MDFNYSISSGTFSTINSFNLPQVAQQVSITTNGFPIQILATGDGVPSGPQPWHRLQIQRYDINTGLTVSMGNIVHIESPGSGVNATVANTWIDTPIAGSYIYSLVVIQGSGTFSYGEASPITMTAEEKVVNSWLSTNWLRKDISGSTTYYGYSSNPNPTDGSNEWFIKKVTSSGTVQSVTWTNGDPILQISSWSNRVNSFTSPTSSLGFTYSISDSQIYPNYKSINLSWNILSGVDRYLIYVTEDNKSVTQDGNYYYGDYPTKEIQNNDYYLFQSASVGKSYSVTLVAKNVAGMTSSSYIITT